MSATVQLNNRQALALEAVRGSATTTKGVLLTIEGRTPGEALNCAVIPLDRVGVVIEGDALELLPKLKLGAQDFVYFDPPYHPETRRDPDLYRFEMTATDHARLLNELEHLTEEGVRWAISGYRCEVYDMYARTSGWHRTDYQAMTRRGVVTESLWTNFDPAMVDLHDHRYLGNDYRERERVQRKVKRWVNKLKALPRHERNAIMAALASIAASGGAPTSSIARSGERIQRGP